MPNYREFYEYRQFAPAPAARSTSVELLGLRQIPFGEHLLFRCEAPPELTFFVAFAAESTGTPILYKSVFGLLLHDRGPASDLNESGLDPHWELQLNPPDWKVWLDRWAVPDGWRDAEF